MQSEIAIEVKNLHKTFKLLDRPYQQISAIFGLTKLTRTPLKKVLRGIDFSIKHGEKVGILGVNGAGKSTLLHLLAGMSKPTHGSISVSGRIGAILELGAGFHGHLTCRQNIEVLLRLNGARKSDLPRLVGRIAEFSELGKSLDSKTKTLSTGMLVRLAFATAICMDPSIFIVDEALAVGDASFQKKCFQYMKENLTDGTLILISHDMAAISALCDRVIVLNGGLVEFDGSPADAIPVYNDIVFGKRKQPTLEDAASTSGSSLGAGPNEIEVRRVQVLVNDQPSEAVYPGDRVSLSVNLFDKVGFEEAEIAISATDVRGVKIFGQSAQLAGSSANKRTTVFIEFNWPPLASGPYSLSVEVFSGANTMAHSQCSLLGFATMQCTMTEKAHGLMNLKFNSIYQEDNL